MERPTTELHNILTFTDASFTREDMAQSIQAFSKQLENDVGLKLYSQHISLTDELAQLSSNAINTAIQTFVTEFDKSANLTKWPCESFKSLERFDKAQELPMQSSLLAANCSDPFVTCSVRFDISGG